MSLNTRQIFSDKQAEMRTAPLSDTRVRVATFLPKCRRDSSLLKYDFTAPGHETGRGRQFNEQHGALQRGIEAFVFSYLLALVESFAAVLLEILVSFFLGCACSRSCSCGTVSLCSISELPPLVLGLSSGLCTSLDIVGPGFKNDKAQNG